MCVGCLVLLKLFPVPDPPRPQMPSPIQLFARDLTGLIPVRNPPCPPGAEDGTRGARQAAERTRTAEDGAGRDDENGGEEGEEARRTTVVTKFGRPISHPKVDPATLVVPAQLPGEGATFRQAAFQQVFRRSSWGDGVRVPKSGAGSTRDYTRRARAILMEVVVRYGIGSMLDIPCGDMTWMPVFLEEVRAVDPNFTYIGADIVPELVEANRKRFPELRFEVMDLVGSKLPKVDLILCRDVLQHLPIADVKRGIKNLSDSGSRYLLTTTCPRQSEVMNRRDIDLQRNPGATVHRALDRPPFSVQDPLVMYSEQREHHKFLALWRTPIKFDPTDTV